MNTDRDKLLPHIRPTGETNMIPKLSDEQIDDCYKKAASEEDFIRKVESAVHQQYAEWVAKWEPVGWYVTGCSLIQDEFDARMEARHIGGVAKALPLFTHPATDSACGTQ